ncbi:DJ-1/PfpI family protein [Candidatus Methylacidiphilum infernorum]|uniref:DJ-1/PfpI family protein n=1 Tax=Candidatus Methylacidiphilum infernorum TaxID=511746 RepID=A0ABX7PX70_9BACT|nr:DJ-1 family glyoxalase III [Candidatus Methylacidiphilum infernorum]QSR87606.1 DJ-1/PfpI family protein [Candidatus Methylacidiphilum infernorum]
MKRALVILAPGFEEIEAVVPIDLLRRAKIEVVVAGVLPGVISGSRKIRLIPDYDLEDVLEEEFDCIILPGGAEGAENLKKDIRIKELLEKQIRAGRWVAAICAAPGCLVQFGLFPSAKMTCHPSLWDDFPQESLDRYSGVVVDGQLITAKAAGRAVEFAFEVIRRLLGEEAVEEVNRSFLFPYALEMEPQKK